jgi:hypothetical protein
MPQQLLFVCTGPHFVTHSLQQLGLIWHLHPTVVLHNVYGKFRLKRRDDGWAHLGLHVHAEVHMLLASAVLHSFACPVCQGMSTG